MILIYTIRPRLEDLVDPFQASFILGRRAADNVITVQEIIHHMNTNKRKNGLVALKK